LIVKLKDGVGAAATARSRTANPFPGTALVRDFSRSRAPARGGLRARAKAASQALARFRVVEVTDGSSAAAALARLRKDPSVEYAEEDQTVSIVRAPNDPSLGELWGLAKIRAQEAWDEEIGNGQVVVAVIDTGVAYDHPDLAANMWTNTGEVPGNGIDDDGNGYVDDLYGYDFHNDDADPMDDHFHGTHCAGTIGAVGDNGVGVVGVCWDVRLMALKFLGKGGSGSSSDAIGCIQYAIDNGAHVMSNSWGGGGFSQALADAVAAAHEAGILFVAAAGNNNSSSPHYPSAYPHVLSVAATDQDDEKASFSNYGSSIDLAAPGVGILSCGLDGTYRKASGTSMATPHVAGLAALLLARNPAMTLDQLELVLTSSAVDLGDPGKDNIYGHGRIDAAAAVASVTPGQTDFPVARLTSPLHGKRLNQPTPILGTAAGPGFASYTLELAAPGGAGWETLATSSQPVEGGQLGQLVPEAAWKDGVGGVRLTVTTTGGTAYSTSLGFRYLTTFLSSPRVMAELEPGSTVAIEGVAGGPGFSSYTIELGEGRVPTSWTPIHTSTVPVEEGTLANWVVSAPEDGVYTVRLRTEFAWGTGRSDAMVSIEGDRLTGWPAKSRGSAWSFNDTPRVVGAPTGPRVTASYGFSPNYLVFYSTNFPELALRAFDDQGGEVAEFDPEAARFGLYAGTPAVADLDEDGTPEIVVVSRVHDVGGARWRLFVKTPDGATIWSQTVSGTDRKEDAVNATIVDLDGDGRLDILCGGDSVLGSIQAFDRDGAPLAGFPVAIPEARGIPRDFVVADLDREPGLELACWTQRADKHYQLTFHRADGSPYPNSQPVVTGEFSGIFQPCPPIAGDLDGDGVAEVVAWAYGKEIGSQIRVLKPTGEHFPGWPQRAAGFPIGLSLGDVSGDPRPEIIAVHNSGYRTYAADGSVLVTGSIGGTAVRRSEPLVADFDADGRNDIAIKVHQRVTKTAHTAHRGNVWVTRVIALDADGEMLRGFPKQISTAITYGNAPRSSGGIALGDVDANGTLDLLGTSCGHFGVPGGGKQSGRIMAWRTSLLANGARVDWGTYRGNQHNTGTATLPGEPLPDVIPPTVRFLRPRNWETLKRGYVEIDLEADDDVGVKSVVVYANGRAIRILRPDVNPALRFRWSPDPKIFAGLVTFTAKARDEAGNVGEAEPRRVLVLLPPAEEEPFPLPDRGGRPATR
jgi:subtilisin family serine protease